tara:strand:+ start:2583 stop:3167 length:585 start_codon:yes stop_codon:yes gene_type:complete
MIILGNIFFKLYPSFLWFNSVGYSELWWFTLSSKIKVFSIFTGAAFLALQTNLWLANRISKKLEAQTETPRFSGPFEFINQLYQNYQQYKAQSAFYDLSAKTHQVVLKLALFVIAIILGFIALASWQEMLNFLNPSSFKLKDPLFVQDISVYIFKLPFLEFLYRWTSLLLFACIGSAGWIYFTRNLLAFILSNG